MRKIVLVTILIFGAMALFACKSEKSETSGASSLQPTLSGSQNWEASVSDVSGLERTETPTLVEKRIVEVGRAVFSGTCEEGATIYVEYDDKLLLTTKSVDGSFIFEIKPKMESAPWDILIYAKAENKNISEPLEQQAEIGPAQESEFADYVWVGKDFRLFFTATESQYLKTTLMNDSKVNWLIETTKQRVEALE